MSYIGHVDGFSSVQSALAKYKFVATNNQTTFTGSDANGNTLAYIASNIIVTLNGIVLDETDFTATNQTSLVLTTGAVTGSEVVILTFNDFVIANHYTQAQSNSLYKSISAAEGGPSLGTNSIIRTNANTISENITIPANTNGMSAGPITIADGNTIILNGTWSIV